MSISARGISGLNVKRYRDLLQDAGIDEKTRETIERLLAEEEAKLSQSEQTVGAACGDAPRLIGGRARGFAPR